MKANTAPCLSILGIRQSPPIAQDRSASGKRDSSAQRQSAQNRIHNRNGVRRDRNAAANARQSWASWQSPGNLAVRKNAWWAWQDSNFQSDRYAETAGTSGSRSIRPSWLTASGLKSLGLLNKTYDNPSAFNASCTFGRAFMRSMKALTFGKGERSNSTRGAQRVTV